MTHSKETRPIWPGACSPLKESKRRDTTPTEQARALAAVTEALKELDRDGVSRVLRWAAEAHGLTRLEGAARGGDLRRESLDFPDPGALLAAAGTSGSAERALLAGFWHQVVRGETDFDAFSVNRALKGHGEGLPNVTKTLSSLMERALVVSLRKGGKTKQARKRYRLSPSGVERAKALLRSP
ncbi:MAG: hypothetical protein WC969_05650 [Elusimicrobiota bacterium]|jgi:hypothetical protein